MDLRKELTPENEKQRKDHLYIAAVIFALVTAIIFYFSKENWAEQRSLLDLYYFPVLVAAVALGWRWGLLYGISATFLGVILHFVMPQAAGWPRELITAAFIIRTILLNFIALVCGYLADLERRESEQIRALATLDSLTNLYNQREFTRRLTEEIARAKRYSYSLCLLILDIDNFKTVNDTYGHQVGNLVLKKIADTLRNSVRNVDCVARYGGDEIAIVGRVNDAAGAQTLAERLRKSIENTKISLPSGKELQLTISVGVSVYPQDCSTVDEIVTSADKALYTAKLLGRNYAMLFSNLGAVVQPVKK
jgi:diguanylate cyclase (GGDEF)-like protein